MAFDGFSAQGLEFLAALPTRDPAWFKANKKDYARLVADPAKDFVVAMGAELARLVPDIVAEPKTNGSISPINNDLRFSPGKAPYKNHLLFRFWEGAPKKTAPTLYVRLAPDSVGFATGLVPADVHRWREFVASDAGAELDSAIARLARGKKSDIAGEGLKRVPAPYPADHARGRLLRHKMLQVRWPEAVPKAIEKPAFVAWCSKRLEQCIPVHRLLMQV